LQYNYHNVYFLIIIFSYIVSYKNIKIKGFYEKLTIPQPKNPACPPQKLPKNILMTSLKTYTI